MRALLTLLLLLSCQTLAAENQQDLSFRPFKAHYVARAPIYGDVGKTTISLRREASYWLLESQSRATGLLAFASSGRIAEWSLLEELEDGRLKLLEYHFRQANKPEKEIVAKLDWTKKQVDIERQNKHTQLALEKDTFDRLSSALPIMKALRQQQTKVVLPTIGRSSVSDKVFTVTGKEVVKTRVGKYEPLIVKRQRSDKRSTITWYAPALDYLPVKIEQYKKGKLVATLLLSKKPVMGH